MGTATSTDRWMGRLRARARSDSVAAPPVPLTADRADSAALRSVRPAIFVTALAASRAGPGGLGTDSTTSFAMSATGVRGLDFFAAGFFLVAVEGMRSHLYESALPISSAFCRAVRTSPAKRPNCLPASLTFLASDSMLPLPLEPGSLTPSTLRLRPSAVRPSTTPPSTPAAAPTIAVATGAATVFTALPTDCAALPAVSAAFPAPCLTASVAPLDGERADDAVRFAPERARPLLDAVRERVRALDARLPELFVAPLLFARLLPFE